MGKKVRSAMGVTVDFDALKIKQQLATTPATTKVKAREKYVEERSNRRAARRAAKKARDLHTAMTGEEDAADESKVDVEELELTAEELELEQQVAEETQDDSVPVPVPTRKQQRKKVESSNE